MNMKKIERRSMSNYESFESIDVPEKVKELSCGLEHLCWLTENSNAKCTDGNLATNEGIIENVIYDDQYHQKS